jgi:hypothetical protein
MVFLGSIHLFSQTHPADHPDECSDTLRFTSCGMIARAAVKILEGWPGGSSKQFRDGNDPRPQSWAECMASGVFFRWEKYLGFILPILLAIWSRNQVPTSFAEGDKVALSKMYCAELQSVQFCI